MSFFYFQSVSGWHKQTYLDHKTVLCFVQRIFTLTFWTFYIWKWEGREGGCSSKPEGKYAKMQKWNFHLLSLLEKCLFWLKFSFMPVCRQSLCLFMRGNKFIKVPMLVKSPAAGRRGNPFWKTLMRKFLTEETYLSELQIIFVQIVKCIFRQESHFWKLWWLYSPLTKGQNLYWDQIRARTIIEELLDK